MTTATKFYRQGDVGIEYFGPSLPENVKPISPDNGRTILAYGEVTGHAHALPATEAPMFEWTGNDRVGHRLIEVKKGGSTLRHEEHAPIDLPEGVYKITQQREYTPEEIRNVAD